MYRRDGLFLSLHIVGEGSMASETPRDFPKLLAVRER